MRPGGVGQGVLVNGEGGRDRARPGDRRGRVGLALVTFHAVGHAGNLAAPSIRQVGEGALRAPGAIADTSAAALRGGAERMMTSALKPTLKEIRKGDAATAINTLLDDNIPLSKKGVETVREKVNDLNVKIKDAIQNSTGTVKLSDVERLPHCCTPCCIRFKSS